ncbi:MAG TPA: methylenetetrahydrofolate reductase [NAD(P)H] [Candidatus Hydrogenedens sp.]|nr:methylenetetrahydrofolate reductase [NAD(P)H] [Candidatus Hydrogenedens sp.]HOK09208.1 methylenetetrahydrofolate reductase [NAD(P)H] [Candidatus Hydrogenedens sp.]HOL19767.1 methylenetetrahydrofolate reductase [NAD(P)H] [Candidatus Hydrogenedens sp.]HPP59039.1 methylenetetrahydrofolate reductase [NAD(P)H] [Candidatus Hydrogenedens sp.]
MRLSELYHSNKPVVSFELFPPKTWQGIAELYEHFRELMKCKPGFVTCTYGAGGTASLEEAQNRTLEVLRWVHGDYPEVPIVSHLTCVNATKTDLVNYLYKAKELGVSGIVALRGDAPGNVRPFIPKPGGFKYAVELVRLIKAEYPEFCILVAGYPEKHPEAISFEEDIQHLKEKVDAGGEVILTQLFYNNENFYRFRDLCEKVKIDVPIVPGILPVTNLAQVRRITSLCGAQLNPVLLERLEKHEKDEEGQFSVGVYYAGRQIEDLLEHGVPGIHFYVLNKSRAAMHICRALTL